MFSSRCPWLFASHSLISPISLRSFFQFWINISSVANWPSASHDPHSVILCFACVFRFGPPETLGIRVRWELFLCQPQLMSATLYHAFIPHLTCYFLNWGWRRDSYSLCSWLQTPWFSFHPLKLILSPIFLDLFLACVFYSCSSSGHLATLDIQPVLFSQFLNPFISSQPHTQSIPYSMANTLAVTL